MLTLRPLLPADADALSAAALESLATVGRWMPWCTADYSPARAAEWIDQCTRARADRSAYEFGIFSADGIDLLGVAGLNQFNRLYNFCNLGYWVRESRQRQGVAVTTVQRLAEFGFEELGLTRIEIVIAEGNDRSKAVARKAGAHFEGVARNRLVLADGPLAASIYSLIP